MCSLAVRIGIILMSALVIDASNSGDSLQIIKLIGQSAIGQIQQTIKNHIQTKVNNFKSKILTVSNSVSAQSSPHHGPVASPVTQHGYNELNSYYNYDLSKFEEHNGGLNYYYDSPLHHPQSYQNFNFHPIPEYHF